MPPDPLPTSASFGGPCHPWVTVDNVKQRCGGPEVTDPAAQFGADLATLILWTATGRRYGLCQHTVRPCYDGPCQCGPAVCGCGLPELELPGPVAAVTEIMVDGAALPLTSVRIKTGGVNARQVLLRNDGEQWPGCNDLEADPAVIPASPTTCPAWHVTYWRGRPVDDLAETAAGMLAEQIARSHCGAGGCDPAMSAQITKVSRKGTTKEFNPKLLRDDNTGLLLTGLKHVDQWIAAVNPNGLRRPSAIVRPDDRDRRRVWSMVEVV